jgi:hypothetical protein
MDTTLVFTSLTSVRQGVCYIRSEYALNASGICAQQKNTSPRARAFGKDQKAGNMYPCIIDYAVNIGLESESEQWSAFLKNNGSLTSDVDLKTIFKGIVEALQQLHNLTLNEKGLLEEPESIRGGERIG